MGLKSTAKTKKVYFSISKLRFLCKKYFVSSKNVRTFATAFREKNDLLAQLV